MRNDQDWLLVCRRCHPGDSHQLTTMAPLACRRFPWAPRCPPGFCACWQGNHVQLDHLQPIPGSQNLANRQICHPSLRANRHPPHPSLQPNRQLPNQPCETPLHVGLCRQTRLWGLSPKLTNPTSSDAGRKGSGGRHRRCRHHCPRPCARRCLLLGAGALHGRHRAAQSQCLRRSHSASCCPASRRCQPQPFPQLPGPRCLLRHGGLQLRSCTA
mmetsp:Transcript_104989/g.185940  ORF Transcript_104989/g.185940 Transcript_104989/m.185940 type:complete len:214 (+) Transcript_104989:3318-3959(+)